MKLTSWNVNGIRAILKKNFTDFVLEHAPDILCLQETKARPEQVELPLDLAGYKTYWNSAEKPGYSGTAIFTKTEPLSVRLGIGSEKSAEGDKEGRVITLEYPGFFLVTVYTPNAKNELARLPYRMEWDIAFAHEWSGIEPDIAMIAKGIGGGFPLGAVLAKINAASGMSAGTHGSTYGGNPLACSVGSKVLEIVSTTDFLNSVTAKSGIISQGILGLIDLYPDVFQEIRGTGLMLGIKCKCPNVDFVQKGYENAILTVPASDNVIRLLPALNITYEEINQALTRLEQTAKSLQKTL